MAQGADSPSATAPPGPTSDPDPDPEVLALDTERNQRVTVPVTIAGQGPFDFMIDTGSQATVLSHDLADRLGLTDRKLATVIGISSRMEAEIAPVQAFTLGSRVFDIEKVPLMDQANIGSADGILGLDSLQEQRVLLDFKQNTFAVADARALGGNRGYDIVVRARRQLGQLIITSAELDGVKVALIVGTGAQGSVGNFALRNRLRGRDLGEATMTDINGVTQTSDMRMAKLVEIGRARITNFPIAFVDSPTFEELGLGDRPALLLGMSELRLFERVAIDFKERKVLFDLPRDVRWHAPGQSF